MKKYLLFVCACIVFTLFGCCSKPRIEFAMTLDGKNYKKIYGHDKRLVIGGACGDGEYSGPGVVAGKYFVPVHAGNGTHVIECETDDYIYQSSIKVFGCREIDKKTLPEECRRCHGNDFPCPNIKLQTHRELCSSCNGSGEHKLKCSECNGKGGGWFKTCKKCIGEKYVSIKCEQCAGNGEMPCDKCGYTDKIACPSCR